MEQRNLIECGFFIGKYQRRLVVSTSGQIFKNLFVMSEEVKTERPYAEIYMMLFAVPIFKETARSMGIEVKVFEQGQTARGIVFAKDMTEAFLFGMTFDKACLEVFLEDRNKKRELNEIKILAVKDSPQSLRD